MFFDRNEIHIQVGVLFNNEKCIIFNSSSSQNYFQDIYSKKTQETNTKQTNNIKQKTKRHPTKNRKDNRQNTVPRTYTFHSFDFFDVPY